MQMTVGNEKQVSEKGEQSSLTDFVGVWSSWTGGMYGGLLVG